MGGTMPKQFILVSNKPVLYYSIQTFLNAFADIQIILVLPVDFTDMGQEIIDAYFDSDKIKLLLEVIQDFNQ
jgi:2-C-methyl-D-erythritol 4-phosphate cytidylyltransferase